MTRQPHAFATRMLTATWVALALAAAPAVGDDPPAADEVTELREDLDQLKADIDRALDQLRGLKTEQGVIADGAAEADRRAAIDRIEQLLARQEALDGRLGDMFDRQRELESEAAPSDGAEPRYDYRYVGEPDSRWAAPEPAIDVQPRATSRGVTTRGVNYVGTEAPAHQLADSYTTHSKSYTVARTPAYRTNGPVIYVGNKHYYRGYKYRGHKPYYGGYYFNHCRIGPTRYYHHYPRHHVKHGYHGHKYRSGSYVKVNTGGLYLVIK